MSHHDQMTHRTVRVVHRVSDRVCLETQVPPDELSAWVAGIQDRWDWWIFKLEIPEESDV